MARTARIVVPGVAHHVVQRGNRRQQTFFSAADYARYVELIGEGCRAAECAVLAWCLMPNHVHLVLVPRDADGLCNALSGAHQRYTWVVNRRNGWQGHLWQSRFYSCPLDEAHLRQAVRYVELNPLRARMVEAPQAWRWSSARGRISGGGDELTCAGRPRALADIGDWSAFLNEALDEEELDQIRGMHRSGKRSGRPLADRGGAGEGVATLPLGT